MLYLIFGVIIFVFIVISIISGINKNYEEEEEDNNYSNLKKSFFAVRPENIDNQSLSDNNKVYGILIETKLKKNEKMLIAFYITGFTGYYQNQGGGIIGGKYYYENHQHVQQELIELCNAKMLTGVNQRKQIRNLSTRLTIKANDFLTHSIPCGTNISGNLNGDNLWFLTKNGVYFVDSDNLRLNNHKFSELLNDAFKIVKEQNTNN